MLVESNPLMGLAENQVEPVALPGSAIAFNFRKKTTKPSERTGPSMPPHHRRPSAMHSAMSFSL
jgi:hypothetical protein